MRCQAPAMHLGIQFNLSKLVDMAKFNRIDQIGNLLASDVRIRFTEGKMKLEDGGDKHKTRHAATHAAAAALSCLAAVI